MFGYCPLSTFPIDSFFWGYWDAALAFDVSLLFTISTSCSIEPTYEFRVSTLP